MHKVAREENAPQIYARALTYIGLTTTSVSLILMLFAPMLVGLVSPSVYYGAHKIIPFVAFSYAFYGMYFVLSAGLNITRRTYYFPFIVGFAAVLNVVLNLLLIPRYRMMAAACSTLISYFMLAILTYFFSQRFYRVPYEYARLTKLSLALLAVLAASLVTKSPVGVLGFLMKSLLFLIFLVLLYIFRFFRKGEISGILRALRRAPQITIGKL
jgi:O-antigen/teichoic acid export membrane protein